MTFVPMVDKAAGDPVTLAMWNSLRDNLNKGVMRPIATSRVTGSPASSLSFASIPADFVDLVLVVNDIPTASAYCRVRFNGDSGANYRNISFTAGGSGPANINLNAASTGIEAADKSFIWVHNYLSAVMHKNVTHFGSYPFLNVSYHGAGVWANTAPISSVEVAPHLGTWDVGTAVTLYGIGGV